MIAAQHLPSISAFLEDLSNHLDIKQSFMVNSEEIVQYEVMRVFTANCQLPA